MPPPQADLVNPDDLKLFKLIPVYLCRYLTIKDTYDCLITDVEFSRYVCDG